MGSLGVHLEFNPRIDILRSTPNEAAILKNSQPLAIWSRDQTPCPKGNDEKKNLSERSAKSQAELLKKQVFRIIYFKPDLRKLQALGPSFAVYRLLCCASMQHSQLSFCHFFYFQALCQMITWSWSSLLWSFFASVISLQIPFRVPKMMILAVTSSRFTKWR